MDLNKFKTSSKLSEDGVKVELGEGASITVARIGNQKYTNELKRVTKPHMNAIRNKTISDELMEKLVLDAFVGTVLLGWDGLKLDGKEVKYSKDEAIKILKNPEYVDFKNMVEAAASEVEVFRAVEVSEAVKN